MLPTILERFTPDDLPWLVLRHQRGEFNRRIVGRRADYNSVDEGLDEWRLAPEFAILKANPYDLERLGIDPDEVHAEDEVFAAIHELPTEYEVARKCYQRQTYGAEFVFFRASSDLDFDFLSASGVLRREIFWKCRETSGAPHLESCRRFPPAWNVLK